MSKNTTSSGLIVSALETHFRSKRDTAVAQLSVYVNSPVGVPDHSTLIKDCADLVDQIASAEESLTVVRNLFVDQSQQSQPSANSDVAVENNFTTNNE